MLPMRSGNARNSWDAAVLRRNRPDTSVQERGCSEEGQPPGGLGKRTETLRLRLQHPMLATNVSINVTERGGPSFHWRNHNNNNNITYIISPCWRRWRALALCTVERTKSGDVRLYCSAANGNKDRAGSETFMPNSPPSEERSLERRLEPQKLMTKLKLPETRN